MFTGIIGEIGTIKAIKKGDIYSKILISADKVLEKTKLGDSISTNGVCLTVANLTNSTFEADVMTETLRSSNIGNLNIGSKVNLERALSLESRLGGHIVSGHIDGTGQIVSMVKEGNAIWISIKTKAEILRYIVYKGSITIDGISLTVAYIDDESFKVSIIPHTGCKTTLLSKNIGGTVNLECDVIGKYVEKMLGIKSEAKKSNNNINENFLRDNGFL